MQAPELGLYDYGARFFDPALGRFIQPDSLVPQPGNPLAWDRYAYANNSPVKYTDPTGHWPEWFDYVMGVGCQFVDDLSLGLFSVISGNLDNNQSQAFAEGRQVGRDASTKVALYETVVGAAELTTALASVSPTTGVTIATAPETGGTSLVFGAGVEVAETAVAIGGAATAVHGTMVLAKIKGGSGAGNFKFPDAKEMAKRLGVDKDTFHSVVKPSILGDEDIAGFV